MAERVFDASTIENDATDAELRMLLDHGWEISDDNREARLYTEEWTPIQIAIFSTECWIEQAHKRGF